MNLLDDTILRHCPAHGLRVPRALRVGRPLRVLRAHRLLRALPALPVVAAIAPALVLPMMLCAEPALAQGAGGTVDAAIARMESTLTHLGGNLGEAARGLLLILFTVDLVMRFGRWAIEESSFDRVFGAWLFQLAFVAMVYVLALLVPELIKQLTELAARFAGYAGAGEKPSASGLVTSGIQQAIGWVGAIRFFEPATWLYLITAIISVIVTAMTVAFLVIAYAEIYLVGLAGIIVLGLAGLEETRSAAIAYIRLLIGKALKLMALMIIYSALNTLTASLTAGSAAGAGYEAALGTIMLQVIGALLIISLPSSVEQLVSNIGSSVAESGSRFVGNQATAGLSFVGGFVGGALLGGGTRLAANIAGKVAGLVGKGGAAAGKAATTAASAGAGTAARTAGKGLMQATEALTPEAARALRDRIAKATRGND